MKISMLYSMMLMLIKHRRVLTRDEIAERFNISKRTVQRCINQLIDAGIPIRAMTGKMGGYMIPDSYKLDCTMFTPEDFSRLSVCLDALSKTFKDELTSDLIAKLYGLSECGAVNGNTLSFTPKLVIDAESWSNSSVKSVKLDAISAAIANDITIDISYVDINGKSTKRLVDPYTLVLKEGVWYVYGKCHTHNAFRIFRVARIKSLEVTGNNFIREGGDVRAALSADFGDKIKLRLQVRDSAIAGIEEWLGINAVKSECGDCVVEAEVADSTELIKRLVSYGDGVKVLAPQSIAEKVRIYAQSIVKQYI